jgi:hypothetical protein
MNRPPCPERFFMDMGGAYTIGLVGSFIYNQVVRIRPKSILNLDLYKLIRKGYPGTIFVRFPLVL